jgi:hypothetical protein
MGGRGKPRRSWGEVSVFPLLRRPCAPRHQIWPRAITRPNPWRRFADTPLPLASGWGEEGRDHPLMFRGAWKDDGLVCWAVGCLVVRVAVRSHGGMPRLSRSSPPEPRHIGRRSGAIAWAVSWHAASEERRPPGPVPICTPVIRQGARRCQPQTLRGRRAMTTVRANPVHRRPNHTMPGPSSAFCSFSPCVTYSPQLAAAFHRRKRPGWHRWRLDETYLRSIED